MKNLITTSLLFCLFLSCTLRDSLELRTANESSFGKESFVKEKKQPCFVSLHSESKFSYEESQIQLIEKQATKVLHFIKKHFVIRPHKIPRSIKLYDLRDSKKINPIISKNKLRITYKELNLPCIVMNHKLVLDTRPENLFRKIFIQVVAVANMESIKCYYQTYNSRISYALDYSNLYQLAENFAKCIFYYHHPNVLDESIHTKISSLESLLSNHEINSLLNLTLPCTNTEIQYFLEKKRNFLKHNNKSKQERLSELTLLHYLYFRHLLVNARLANSCSNYIKTNFDVLEKELRDYLDNDKLEICYPKITENIAKFFTPFNYLDSKLTNFWQFELPLSFHYLNYYGSKKTSDNFYETSFDKNESGEVHSCIQISPYANNIPMLLAFTMGHEFAHHIQLTSYKYKPSTFGLSKLNGMYIELEADMYAGFFSAHSKGLNLSDDILEQVSEEVRLDLGDKSYYFDYEIAHDPHGKGYQRKRAFTLGINLAKKKHYKIVNQNTKFELHDFFTQCFKQTDAFRFVNPFSTIASDVLYINNGRNTSVFTNIEKVFNTI